MPRKHLPPPWKRSRFDRPEPSWRFEPLERRDIHEHLFDGYTVAEWSYGWHTLSVTYDAGRWWFEDAERKIAQPCRSMGRAFRLFWRRAGALYGRW